MRTIAVILGILALLAFAGHATAGDYDDVTYIEAGPISPFAGVSLTPIADTRLCESILITGEFTGDSLRYYIDYSWDKSTFWLHDSATVASGSDVWNRVVLTKTVGAATYSLDRVMWPYVRLRVKNMDHADDLTDITLKIWCGR